MKTNFNKILYIGFVVLSIYFIVFKRDFSDAAIQLGIALAFDPFDQTVSWKERPTWQKAVLIIHLAIVAALLGYDIGFNDK
jgi:hypothetical protein